MKTTDIIKLIEGTTPELRKKIFRHRMQKAKQENPIAYASYLGLTKHPKKKAKKKR